MEIRNLKMQKTEMLTKYGLAVEYFPDYERANRQMHALDIVLISIY